MTQIGLQLYELTSKLKFNYNIYEKINKFHKLFTFRLQLKWTRILFAAMSAFTWKYDTWIGQMTIYNINLEDIPIL